MKTGFTTLGWATLLALSGGVLPAQESSEKSRQAWIWQDNFEDGLPLNAKYEDVSTSGLAVTNRDPFQGSYSLQQTYQPNQVDAGWVIKKAVSGYPDRLFMRWYHKFETGFVGFPPKMARIRYRMADWSSPLEVHCWLDTSAQNGGAVTVDVKAVHSTQANSSGWLSVNRTDFTFANPANIGRWVCFEMEVQLNSPGSADGAYRLWIDDELKAERINLDLRGTQTYQMNEAMLDCYWNGGAPRVQSRFYDNFAIATTRIGLDSPSTLTITAPNGGETWRRGETRAITWTPGSVTGDVAIELVQNGTAVGIIAENIAATAGTFAWTVGRLANGTISTGTGCRIRIRAVSSGISTQSHPF